MKAQRLFGLGVMAVALIGLAVAQADAAVVQFEVRLASGETGQVVDPNIPVAFEVYAVITNGNADANDDGLLTSVFNLIDTGDLLGDLTFALNSNFDYTSSSSGTVKDLDSDGDDDVGNTDPAVDTDWIIAIADSYPNPEHGDELLLGTGLWTMDDPGALIGDQTQLQFGPSNRITGAPSGKKQHRGTSDGTDFSLPGSSVDVGTAVTITYVPEPMTLGLLAIGGLALLRRRRR